MKQKIVIISTVVIGLAALFFAIHTQNSEEEIAGNPAESVPTLGTSQPMESKPLDESTRSENLEQEAAEANQLSSFKGAEALPQTEQESLWTAFSEARRKIRPLTDHQKTMPENEGALYLASSPSQKIRARFLEDGVRLLSGYPGREWNAVMSLDTDGDVLEVRQDGTQIEYVRDGIVEWFHNKPEGLEHGYIVERPTTEYTEYTEGQLVVPVKIAGLEVQELEEGGLQFVNEAGEPVLSYDKLKVWDANGIELATIMESTASGLNILVADIGAAYPITIDPLITSLEAQLGPDVTGSGAPGDNFGYSVSVSGDTALIGARFDDDAGSSSGSAYVFVQSGTNWSEQAKLIANDGAAEDYFGHSVSVSGNTALVGAWGDDLGTTNDMGSAYVFIRNGTNWNQQAKLRADDGIASDNFGISVSIDVDIALIGAYQDDDNGFSSGSAYVFVRSGSIWTQQDKLIASDGSGHDYFGYSVSVSGDTALVGAYGDDDVGSSSGSAYVFVQDGTNWPQQAKFPTTGLVAGDYFGYSVSLDGDTAVVGAKFDDDDGSNAGCAYIFERSGITWSPGVQIKADDGAGGNNFGASVSVSGDTVLVCAPESEDGAYLFVRDGSSWTQLTKLPVLEAGGFCNSVCVDGDTVLVGSTWYGYGGIVDVFVRNGSLWASQAELSAGSGSTGHEFGHSVSVDGDTAIIGVPNEDSAYILVRNGTNWTEQARLNPTWSGQFGYAVSISSDTALIGSDFQAFVYVRNGTNWSQEAQLRTDDNSWELGNSVSLDGNTAVIGSEGDDDFGISSGAAYVFVRNANVWTQQAKLTAGDNPAAEDYFGCSVSVSSNTVLVGAYKKDRINKSDAGAAYIFTRNGTNWNEQAKLTAADGEQNDWFGYSVSVDADTAIVGAYRANNTSFTPTGNAYVYRQNGTNWTEEAKLSVTYTHELFGYSVCVEGDTAVIGAIGTGNSRPGSAYVFSRSGTIWSEQIRITADDVAEKDGFGCSVSLSGDTALVGAYQDDGPDLHGGLTEDQGSVYVYRLTIPVADISISTSSRILANGASEILGNQAVGIGKTLTFTIANEAVGDFISLTDLSITKDGADAAAFIVGELGATSLTNGESTTFRVTYTPPSVGGHSTAIHIFSNDPDESPFDINLTGTGLANTDSDPGSDAWETANGFSPTVDGDVMSLDSDGDGSPDIMEIYQGTERYPAIPESAFAVMALNAEGDENGFSDVYTSNGVLKVRYRRSTTQTAVNAQGIWVPDLVDSTWLYSGESASGTVVTVTENVVSNGAGYEIVESSAEVTSGDTESLFFTLELTPNE